MNRFDLEQKLMGLLTISDDLDLVVTGILEHDLDEDEVANILVGISGLLKLKQNELMDTMCRVLKLDKYSETKETK